MSQYTSLRAKIAAESAARRARYAEFEAAWQRAMIAGMEAGNAAAPTPMVVTQTAGITDKVTNQWYVSEGACGFAEVVFPGNTSFARWAKSRDLVRKAWPSGVSYWVAAHGQSVDRKDAHARAVARVLGEAGIQCYATSRLD